MTLMSKLYNRLYKLLYIRMCRAYARHSMQGDEPAGPVMRFLCSLDFWKVHGFWPHLKNPRTFSEKVCNRMLYSRNHLWVTLTDKLRVRDYVCEKVGSEYLPPLLWHGDKPEEIPFDELPLKFVIKTTHGCGYNIIVMDKTQLDRTKTRRQLKKWLDENFCQDKWLGTSWAYKNIRPSIIVETFLEDNGSVPVDYKFYCFSGCAEFIQLDFERFEEHKKLVFDRDFNLLDIVIGVKKYCGMPVRPENLEDMIRVADSLAGSLDFIRVDLYSVGGQTYVGELTCYPGAARLRFIPRKYDFLFGEKWKRK